MKTTSTYGADLIDVMGSDLTVVNAARVSFDKFHYHFADEGDAKLIAYLARNGHWSPFSHPQLSFRVSAPIFVARQLAKHQVGLAWNEVSRRYVDSPPEFYTPEVWRKKADNVKQGSRDEAVEVDELYLHDMRVSQVELYLNMLDSGICPEQARMVLPQSMMTEWIWTGSLYAFARVVNQRLDPHAQKECRPVAEDIAKALREHFPVSSQVLLNTVEPA